jgi:hypothetical protein
MGRLDETPVNNGSLATPGDQTIARNGLGYLTTGRGGRVERLGGLGTGGCVARTGRSRSCSKVATR